MKLFVFVLGTAHELAKSELESVLIDEGLKYLPVFHQERVLIVQADESLDALKLIKRLGGTVKIGTVICTDKEIDQEKLASIIDLTQSKVDFGISTYFAPQVKIFPLLKDLKTLLKSKISNVRFVMPKLDTEISSIVVLKQKLQELLIIFDKVKNQYYFAKTLVTQNAPDWNLRDYGRPFADPKSGMLPPKVARMMVNLCRPKNSKSDLPVILDPFCGMGTILAEALLLGHKVIGSDALADVIKKTESNLDWLVTNYNQINKANYQLITSDATHVSEKLSALSVDAIVTEPFMGIPFEMKNNTLFHKNEKVSKVQIENILKGLEKLYIGALKDWHKILKPSAKIVMIMPEIIYQRQEYSVKKIVDSCENLGYTLLQGPLIYSRPQAIVRRKIFVFSKK